MAVTSAHLEKACDKLLRWCSIEFRGMGRDASLEVSDELSEAVRRLRSRPELLSYVVLRFHLHRRLTIGSTHPFQRSPDRSRTNAPSHAPFLLHQRSNNRQQNR
jgi:conserved oligomeric Golgi complex subunit COG6-like protein